MRVNWQEIPNTTVRMYSDDMRVTYQCKCCDKKTLVPLSYTLTMAKLMSGDFISQHLKCKHYQKESA